MLTTILVLLVGVILLVVAFFGLMFILGLVFALTEAIAEAYDSVKRFVGRTIVLAWRGQLRSAIRDHSERKRREAEAEEERERQRNEPQFILSCELRDGTRVWTPRPNPNYEPPTEWPSLAESARERNRQRER